MKIPNDIDEAFIELKSIGELVTSSEWQRAALVYAFTEDRGRGGDNRKSNVQNCTLLSVKDFADQGLSGLHSRVSVSKYRRAWSKAIEAGLAEDIGPGDDISLPDADWTEFTKVQRKPPEPRNDTMEDAHDINLIDMFLRNKRKFFTHKGKLALIERLEAEIEILREETSS